MKKILKKGKRGNRKERMVAYEEMKSLNGSSTRIEFDPDADSGGSSSR